MSGDSYLLQLEPRTEGQDSHGTIVPNVRCKYHIGVSVYFDSLRHILDLGPERR